VAAAYLEMLPGVLLAAVLGVIPLFTFGNPGAIMIIAGMIGGMIGGVIDKRYNQTGKSKNYWNLRLSITGFVFGFVLDYATISVKSHRIDTYEASTLDYWLTILIYWNEETVFSLI